MNEYDKINVKFNNKIISLKRPESLETFRDALKKIFILDESDYNNLVIKYFDEDNVLFPINSEDDYSRQSCLKAENFEVEIEENYENNFNKSDHSFNSQNIYEEKNSDEAINNKIEFYNKKQKDTYIKLKNDLTIIFNQKLKKEKEKMEIEYKHKIYQMEKRLHDYYKKQIQDIYKQIGILFKNKNEIIDINFSNNDNYK